MSTDERLTEREAFKIFWQKFNEMEPDLSVFRGIRNAFKSGFEAAQVPGSTEERLREALDAEMMSTAKWLFAEYFRKNYPGPKTIITDPDWHAPKIFAAVVSSLKEVSLFPISSKAAPPAPASERELIARWRKWANKVLASPIRSLETEAQANGWLQCADELERLLTRPEPQEQALLLPQEPAKDGAK